MDGPSIVGRPSEKSALTYFEKLQAGIKKSIRVEKVI